MMQGTSRTSLRELRDQLGADVDGRELESASGELLAVAALLGRETSLRAALSDPSSPPEAREGMVRGLLGKRIGAPALSVVAKAVRARWSKAGDLPDALEQLGAQAAFDAAERSGRLDAVEDELFRFGRILEAQPALRGALEDPAIEPDRRAAILQDLLQGRAEPVTMRLLEHVVRSPRGRRVAEAVEGLVELAAERRAEILAEVRVAVDLDAGQERRLAAALARIYGRAVRLQVQVDPQVLGGAVIKVGDEVIDGSVLHKLEEAGRRLTG